MAADANKVNAGLGAGVPEGVELTDGVLVAVLEELEVILGEEVNVAVTDCVAVHELVNVGVTVRDGVREAVGVVVGVILGGIINSACTTTPEPTIE